MLGLLDQFEADCLDDAAQGQGEQLVYCVL